MSAGIPVDDVIKDIKAAVSEASISTTNTERDLSVTEIQLGLNAVATTVTGGKLEFRIPVLGATLKAGRTITDRDTHAINITLKPPELSSQHETRGASVQIALLDAIHTIRTIIASATTEPDPFILKQTTIELSFVVNNDGSFAFGINGELSNEITQTIKITLADPNHSPTSP